MQQQTFAEVTFDQYRKPTRRERFLDEMKPGRTVGRAGRHDRAGLSQGRGTGASTHRPRTHATPALSATVVQSIRSGGGGSPLGLSRHATVGRD
jgi:hypothetical protein